MPGSLSPSFYLADLERKRARDRELQQGLGAGAQQVISGLTLADKLRQELKTEDDAKDAKDYGRSVNDRNQARADTSAKLNDALKQVQIDNEKAKGGAPLTAMGVLSDPVMQKYLHSDDGGSAGTDDEPTSNMPAGAASLFDKIKASLDNNTQIMTTDAQTKVEKLRLTKERADAAARKNRDALKPKDPNAQPTVDEQIKAARLAGLVARAKLADDKLAHIDPSRPVGKVPSEGTVSKLAVDKSIVAEINTLADDADDKAFGVEGAALERMPDSAKSPERRAFESRIHQMALHIASAYKGSVTDAEVQVLERNLMHASDTGEGFKAIAHQEAKQLANRIKMREQNLHDSGYAVGGGSKAIEHMTKDELGGLSDEELQAIAKGQ